MTGPTQHAPVPVLAAWDETPTLRGLRVELPPELSRMHVLPGQVVKIRTDAGEGFFALASAPDPAGPADLLVKRGGRVADAVIDRAEPGARLEVTPPFGKGFPVEAAEGKDVLLFAAGSAIAPIRALVQHVIRHRARFGRITLFYGQRHGAEFAYLGEHMAWERRGVRVVLCPTRADDAWRGLRGRVQEVAHSLAFGGCAPGEAVAFVSGMTAMVEDVRRTLARSGIPPERVHANF